MVRRRSFSAVSNHEASTFHPSRRDQKVVPEPVKKYCPHPEELAKEASRRMDTMQGLAAILRDARKDALLQRQRRSRCAGMRSGIYFTTSQDEGSFDPARSLSGMHNVALDRRQFYKKTKTFWEA
jgi:hypothetical protein